MSRMGLLVVLFTCLLWPAPAHAGLWGWLEEFSGPGPFEGPILGASLGQTFCPKNDNDVVSGTPPEERVVTCLWFDGRFFRTRQDDRGFPPTDVFLIDTGPTVSLFGLVTAGGGAGIVHLVSDAAVETKSITKFTLSGRVTISPIRMATRGAIWIATGEKRIIRAEKWLGLLKLYYKPTYVFGTFSGTDLGVPDVPCGCGNELRQSWGISLDFMELTPFGTMLR